MQTIKQFSKKLSNEWMSSVVVFLVALPLCMGVAIASGVPPALGLFTGIVGGLIVGIFAGQPLQVSGPAAGLAVIVWQIVEQFGLPGLALAVLMTGILQYIAGSLKLGQLFKAVSPGVIQGMLAGIGLIILIGQLHVMIDHKPFATTLESLIQFPQRLATDMQLANMHALIIGCITILGILIWQNFKPKALKMIPGALVGVLAAIAVSQILSFSNNTIDTPNLVESINWLQLSSFALFADIQFIIAFVGLAVIASAETLLCATATDFMHSYDKTDYDQELKAQGIGNLVCGVLGALPVCGVIVRSSANIEAGATNKWSAILHGAWLLLFVAILPFLLAYVPTASLAAILVFTGWKLLNLQGAAKMYKTSKIEFSLWLITLTAIVATNLLIGIIIGLVAALLVTLWNLTHLDVTMQQNDCRVDLHFYGAATFLSLPKLSRILDNLPDNAEIHVHLDEVRFIDHACFELFETWEEQHSGTVHLDLHSVPKTRKAMQTPAHGTSLTDIESSVNKKQVNS